MPAYVIDKASEHLTRTVNCENVVEKLPENDYWLFRSFDDVCELTKELPDESLLLILPMVAEPSWSCMRYRYPCEIYKRYGTNQSKIMRDCENEHEDVEPSNEVLAERNLFADKPGCGDKETRQVIKIKPFYVARKGKLFPEYKFLLANELSYGRSIWVCYIVRMPFMNRFGCETYRTHRVWCMDKNRCYIDFHPAPRTYDDAKKVARAWVDMIENYIKNEQLV